MTNPPIPPAVVEAMAREMCCGTGNCQQEENGRDCDALVNAGDEARNILQAALATGSVVICSPELKALIDRNRELATASVISRDYVASKRRREEAVQAVINAARAFARAHQEEKG